MDTTRVISDVYYNSRSPACYAGANAVFRECKKRNKNITRAQVDNFLAAQEAYTRHRQARRRFRRNITQTAGLDVDWQADLADLRMLKLQNNGYQYLLVCIDVLSRFAFVVPIKRKTPQLTGAAFEHIINTTDRLPWILTTDRGLEFKGKPFQQVMQKHDIQHKYATSPDVKCAIAERWIQTLKSRIWKFFTRNKTKRYIDVLPDLVSAINNSVNRTLKRTPASVTSKNQTTVWLHLYGRQRNTVKQFKIGDRVRIAIEKHVLSKGYRPNYSSEIFTVSKILPRQPATYKITDDDDEVIEGVFYNEELIRVVDDQRVRKIETLKKTETRDGELWHLVKFSDGKQSWIRNEELVSI